MRKSWNTAAGCKKKSAVTSTSNGIRAASPTGLAIDASPISGCQKSAPAVRFAEDVMDGAEVLVKLKEEQGKKGIAVALARVPDSQLDLLIRAGTIEAVGRENVFATVRDAVTDQNQNAAGAS
jgi:MFS superfamily sulfate permease-like transporter